MSTSLLYNGVGVRSYTHCAVGFGQGEVAFRVEQQPDTFRCAGCGSAEVTRSGVVPRRLQALPIGNKPVWIELPVQRLVCAACGKTRQAEVAFADARRGYTRAFERYALDLTLSGAEGSAHMTIKDVAQHLGVSWDAIPCDSSQGEEMQPRRLRRRFAAPKLKHLRHLAIDDPSTALRASASAAGTAT